MSLKNQIIEHLEPLLEDNKYFVVDIQISPSKVHQKITILLDSDAGISIDECANISRKLGHTLEEQDIVPNAYTLEVSSPGVDYPLSSQRQFQKNIGRRLKVIMKDGTEQLGTIQSVNEDSVVILTDKKRKIEAQEITIAFPEISKAQIQINFN